MKNTKVLFVAWLTLITSQVPAQFCTEDARFSEVDFFTNTQIDSLKNVTYGNALNWEGNPEDLIMDFYFPKNEIDPMPSRPFVLLIHGGGFTGGERAGYILECKELAKRGYVVANIDYRLGYDPSDDLTFIYAVYRAQQDVNAALRYSIEIAPTLKIDPTWIFLGGSSAGSITSLYTKYMKQEDWNVSIPGIETLLGSLDTSGNNLPHIFELDGLLNQWGASFDAATTTDELIPMISFHGALDNVVPVGDGPFGNIGSQILHDRLIENGICSDLTLDPKGGHVVYYTQEGREFMVNRTSCFFKSLFCENCEEYFSTEPIEADCSTTLSINEYETLNNIAVYPNPFKDRLNFNNLSGSEYFYLYNIQGQIIYEGSDIESQNFYQLSSGLYILRIVADEGGQSLKLFKE